MKVLLVSVTEAMPEKAQEIYQDVFRKICGNSNELVIRDVTPGMTRMPDLVHSYARLINAKSFCDRTVEAQAEGFDAVVTT